MGQENGDSGPGRSTALALDDRRMADPDPPDVRDGIEWPRGEVADDDAELPEPFSPAVGREPRPDKKGEAEGRTAAPATVALKNSRRFMTASFFRTAPDEWLGR